MYSFQTFFELCRITLLSEKILNSHHLKIQQVVIFVQKTTNIREQHKLRNKNRKNEDK